MSKKIVFTLCVELFLLFISRGQSIQTHQEKLQQNFYTESQNLRSFGISEQIQQQGNPIEERLAEFKNAASEIAIPASSTVFSKINGEALYEEYDRYKKQDFPLASAYGYMAGPNNSVLPANGEYINEDSDFKLPTRGGIGFFFTRRYASFDKNDYGMGKGWRHNYDIFISEINSDRLILHLNERNIEFYKKGNLWQPSLGNFFSLTFENDYIYIFDANLTRYAFSRAQRNKCWRLSQIASRHGYWQKNIISIKYLKGSDRIDYIVEPYNNKVDFFYDAQGHICALATKNTYVKYSYDTNGLLVSVEYPGRTNFAYVIKQGLLYTYDAEGFLTQKDTLGLPCYISIKYDSDKRVIYAGLKSKQAESSWEFTYNGKETSVIQPYPLPQLIYSFNSSIHRSLPSAISQPTLNATSIFEFNEDGLLTKEVTPFGRTDCYKYDSQNTNPSFRANLLVECSVANLTNGVYSDFTEKGKEFYYHSKISLPVKTIYYQIKNGKKETIRTDLLDYSEKDYTLEKQESSGIITKYWFNSFGEPAIVMNSQGTATIYEYAKSDEFVSYEFQSGEPDNGGFLCKKTTTNNINFIANSLKQIGSYISLPQLESEPVSTYEQYSYDCFGKNIRRQSEISDELYLYNNCADLLASFSSDQGMTVHSYNGYGKPVSIYHEFIPRSVNSFQGHRMKYFGGCFYTESFQYDDFGALFKHFKTDEPDDMGRTMSPTIYLRHPSGKVKSITSSDGTTRVDVRHPITGLLLEQFVENETHEKIVLSSNFNYYQAGVVKSFTNHLGGTITFLIDGFGDKYAEISALGITTQEQKNILGQKTAIWSYKDGVELARTENIYNENNQLQTVVVYQYFNGNVTKNITEEYKYDALGNVIAKKGGQADSWEYFLYDGLNREIASESSSGDFSYIFWGERVPFCKMTFLKNPKTNMLERTGQYIIFDYAGREVKKMSISTKGKLSNERSILKEYNSVGQIIKTISTGLTTTEKIYNTLGQITTEKIIPTNTNLGEKETITQYRYDTSGRLLTKELSNTALALIKSEKSVVPQAQEAPQITKYFYDSLGRESKTIQPDGLVTEYLFNEHSLPSRMIWYKIENPKSILRDLTVTYSVLGQCLSVTETNSQNLLRKNEFDLLGNCIKSIDIDNWGNQITITRQFDSVGTKRCETIAYGDMIFPTQKYAYDLLNGKIDLSWEGLKKSTSVFWQDEHYVLDASGRLRSLSLTNSNDFATWNYMGSLPISRTIKASSITTETQYNEFLEEENQIIRNCVTKQIIGKLDYGYGPQGQSEYAAIQLQAESTGKDYLFASYSKFDSYRRLVAQNAEQFLPNNRNWRERASQLFNVSDDHNLSAIQTQRMAYDQANNIWVNYTGSFVPPIPQNFVEKNNPLFISQALPLTLYNGNVQDLDLQELASNRDVSKARFSSENGTLQDEMYKYDELGCLIEFFGTYWDGIIKHRVKWELSYDSLGRLVIMKGYARDDIKDAGIKKDEKLAELHFSYDSENRRITKKVIDYLSNTCKSTYTIYSGNNQALVFYDENGEAILKEQYLWRPGSRELLMAAMPKSTAQNVSSRSIERYYFQQDKGFNVIFSSKYENGKLTTVSAMSYLGFGENATKAEIINITSSVNDQNKEFSYNKTLDDRLVSSWLNLPGQPQFIELELAGNDKLSILKIWAADNFPKNFAVFVLPPEVPSPSENYLGQWVKNNLKHICAGVQNGKCFDFIKTPEWETPYQIPLCDRMGDRVVIVWEQSPLDHIDVREFEIIKVPNNPTAISFAGQLLDLETNMYYQINRYRLAGANKFISPDPLGYFDGNNLYAYAHNNPLEWHDPDGRWAHVLAGAGIGAVLGGGMYALNCWITGQEFSWAEFGVSVFAGAVSGAIAAALLPVNPILAGAVAGAVGGAIAEGGITYIRTGDWEKSLVAAGKGAIWGGAAGAFAGSLGLFGGNSSSWIAGLFQSIGSGSLTGGLFGGARTAWEVYDATGDIGTAFFAAQQTAIRGAIMGGIAGGAGFSLSRAVNGITTDKRTSVRNVDESTYNRPSGYRKGVRDAVWEASKDVQGHVRDPKTGRFMSKEQPWDMGHKPGAEYYKFKQFAKEHNLSRQDVLDWNNNPNHFRPELPSSNRCHAMEDSSSYFIGFDTPAYGGVTVPNITF